MYHFNLFLYVFWSWLGWFGVIKTKDLDRSIYFVIPALLVARPTGRQMVCDYVKWLPLDREIVDFSNIWVVKS